MIIFFYGPDTYRSRQKVNELKDKFKSEIDKNSQSLVALNGATANLKEIGEKINTGSLFVKKRMVIIEDIFENKSDKMLGDLADFLKKKEKDRSEESDIIIFKDGNLEEKKFKKERLKLLSFLKEQKYVQEFKNLTNAQLGELIKELVEKSKRQIEASASYELISRANSDVWRIVSEINKLSMLIPEKGIITSDLVKEQISGTYDENIFSLMDAISTRNKKLALTILEEQYLAGLSDDYILSMLIRQFKILFQIKSAVSSNFSPLQIANELKLHSYVVKKSLGQAQSFSLEDLQQRLNHLIDLDLANKTGQKELKTELLLFIAKI